MRQHPARIEKNELSLFSGAGGGLLGTKLLGWNPIGYVEWDDYCQRVLAARIKDGYLPNAPIFGNIKTFISDGYAASYTGLVDVITGGFPCQPFSVAGKQKGADDERNMWPATATVIGIVKPRFVLLENVPGVRTYLPVVVRDLRRRGYEVSRPLILGADDVGAPHRRKRVWIVAHDAKQLNREYNAESMQRQVQQLGVCYRAANVADTPQRQDDGRKRGNISESAEGRESINSAIDSCGEDVADSHQEGLSDVQGRGQDAELNGDGPVGGCGWWDADPAESRDVCAMWGLKSRVGRVAHGVANRVDRLKAIGNGQVPAVVRTAWELLTGEIVRQEEG